MKQKRLLQNLSMRWLLLAMLFSYSMSVLAEDFEYKGITYTVISMGDKTCKTKENYKKGITNVEYPGNTVTGDLILPNTVYYSGKFHSDPYKIKSISSYSFGIYSKKSSLKSIVIPPSVETIEELAFAYCPELSSVSLSDSLRKIGKWAFLGCTKIKDLELPPSLLVVDGNVFDECTLTPLKLNSRINVNSTSSYAQKMFEGLNPKSYIVCRKKDVEYYRGLTTLEVRADDDPYSFYIDPLICGAKIVLEENDNYYLPEQLEIKVISSDGSVICSSNGYKPEYYFTGLNPKTEYKIKATWTNKEGLEEEYIEYFSTKELKLNAYVEPTQTSLTIRSISCLDADVSIASKEMGIIFGEERYPYTGTPIVLNELYPESTYSLKVYLDYNENSEYLITRYVKTNPWNCNVTIQDISPTTVTVDASFEEQDAIPIKTKWTYGEETIDSNPATFSSLVPDSELSVSFIIYYGERTYSYHSDFKTTSLEFNTLRPKCVSNSCAIVAAETNISDLEPNVGFEWRKIDAPASIPSNEGYGAICDGMLEGYIKNLQSTSYYNVRPFYKDANGNYYYGEVIGFDPSDFSYFEPTVRTYPVQNVSGNTATVRGYVLPGTDNIIGQGFQYWKNGRKNVKGNAPAESEIMTVKGTGQVMTVTLEDLEDGTDYTFRVFVETEAGFTYGEEQTFTTEGTSSIEDIAGLEDEVKVVGYYNMYGVRFDRPQQGVNIIVYSDGSSRKVIY